MKMRGSGASSSVKLGVSGSRTRLAGTLVQPLTAGAGRSKSVVGRDERQERKEILKMIVSGTAKHVKW